jgi:TRAP-type mannitol/chloroaromatic compound transport system substrate-binding protein
MHRRAFLRSTGAAAASAAVAANAGAMGDAGAAPGAGEVAAPHVAPRTRRLRLAFAWRDDIAGAGEQAVRLARRIERATDGRLAVTLARTQGDAFAAVAADAADLVHGTELHHVARHPAFAFFGGLPGAAGLAPHDLAAWIAVGGGQALWDDLAGAYGVKPLLVGHLGERPALWSTAPISRLADVAGQRVHALGLAQDVVRAAGAEPVALPADEIAAALAAGEIAAAEWGGALASLAIGVPRTAKHVAGFSLSCAGTALSLAIRVDLWDDLDPADQTVIAAAAAQELQLGLAEARAHERVVRAALASHHGIRFAPANSDGAHAIARLADAVVADASGRDDRAARINASYMGFRDAIGVGMWPIEVA